MSCARVFESSAPNATSFDSTNLPGSYPACPSNRRAERLYDSPCFCTLTAIEFPHVGKIVMRYISALESIADSGNRGSFIRLKDSPYHLDSNSVTPSPPAFVLIWKYESWATTEAVAHKSARAKRMVLNKLASPHSI